MSEFLEKVRTYIYSHSNAIGRVEAYLVACAILIILFVIIYGIVYASTKKTVLATSNTLKSIKLVNQRYKFAELEKTYSFSHGFNNKNSYDNCNIEHLMCNYIESDIDYFGQLIGKVDSNRELYNEYCGVLSRLDCVSSDDSLNQSHVLFKGLYKRIEKNLYLSEIQYPTVSPKFSMIISYASPKGRNKYKRVQLFQYKEIISLYAIVKQRIENKNSASYQRQLMTPSLRTAVMKRDKYRCVLCGRSVKEDGVKLEVDHIVPISKGGKTVISNLQTLCIDCNRGKGADIGYEEF